MGAPCKPYARIDAPVVLQGADVLRILIVEDDRPISNLIRLSLSKAGYACDCAFEGSAAADMVAAAPYDLVLLDVMLPGINGFELMEYIKTLGVPVVFLTAVSSLENRVRGLRMGAEDYIVKPFEVDELLARVEVVLRRYGKAEDRLEIEGLVIDTRAMCVKRGSEEIALTRKEYELLVLFARNPNVALYRETIYERVWGGDLSAGSKTVDLHVQRLRKKTGLSQSIQAVSKVGYRLVTP